MVRVFGSEDNVFLDEDVIFDGRTHLKTATALQRRFIKWSAGLRPNHGPHLFPYREHVWRPYPALLFLNRRLISVNTSSLCMAEGIQKRIQPDLVRQIEEYSGGSFSEKMVKWKNDVNRLSHEDIKTAVREALPSGMFQ